MLHVEYYFPTNFLCKSNFTKVKRLSQIWGESGHPQCWGILPDVKLVSTIYIMECNYDNVKNEMKVNKVGRCFMLIGSSLKGQR